MRTKALAVLLAAVLGIVGGVVTSFAIPRTLDDPLGLGIGLANLTSCDGTNVVMIGWGSTAAAMAGAVAANSDRSVHYLQPSKSCATIWKYQPDPTKTLPDPDYVAYLGPFTSRQDACAIRMSGEHKGDFVTRLHQGNTEMVQCVCFVAASSAPTLSVNMTNNTEDSIWIRQLQQILIDIRDLPETFKVTGFYDPATGNAIGKIQLARGLEQTGAVDAETWQQIQKTACHLYRS